MTRQRSSSTPSTEHHDPYREITDRIIAALESGTKPWQRPWNPDLAGGPATPVNGATGRRYHGMNVLLLAMSSFAFGGDDPRFCTYKQAADRGWQVKRGERGTVVIFFKRLQIADRDAPDGAEDRTKRIPLLRTHTVFHASQIEGIAPYAAPDLAATPWRRPDAADVILRNSQAVVRIGGERAFYSPQLDFVQLPPEISFTSPEHWAATALHELAHWSGAESRLHRDLQHRFGSTGYAQEELRAELASVFIGAETGLPCDIENHASYIASWIRKLREDRKEIFRAAADAQRIADYLLAFHPNYAARSDTGADPSGETAGAGDTSQTAEAA